MYTKIICSILKLILHYSNIEGCANKLKYNTMNTLLIEIRFQLNFECLHKIWKIKKSISHKRNVKWVKTKVKLTRQILIYVRYNMTRRVKYSFLDHLKPPWTSKAEFINIKHRERFNFYNYMCIFIFLMCIHSLLHSSLSSLLNFNSYIHRILISQKTV